MGLLDIYNTVIHEHGDERVKDWVIANTPVPILLITASYLYFVLKCGPRFMANRPAYKLTTLIKYYNIFQIVANAGVLYEAYRINWFRDYGFICRGAGYDTDLQSMQILRLIHVLQLLKLFDYAETVIFVLRKKQRQISFLHLYHHVSTVWLCWVCLKYFGIGSTLIIILVNSAVHVIMYSYYYLSSFGPSVRQRIQPFKRMVTVVQLVQFIFLMVATSQGYFSYCPISRKIIYLNQINLMINLILFSNFYRKTYMKPKRK